MVDDDMVTECLPLLDPSNEGVGGEIEESKFMETCELKQLLDANIEEATDTEVHQLEEIASTLGVTAGAAEAGLLPTVEVKQLPDADEDKDETSDGIELTLEDDTGHQEGFDPYDCA
jgi:hypothetical protein